MGKTKGDRASLGDTLQEEIIQIYRSREKKTSRRKERRARWGIGVNQLIELISGEL